MPKGIHNSPRGGRKPMCICGSCYTCKQRVRNQRYRESRKRDIVDEVELEKRMIEKFIQSGWDKI